MCVCVYKYVWCCASVIFYFFNFCFFISFCFFILYFTSFSVVFVIIVWQIALWSLKRFVLLLLVLSYFRLQCLLLHLQTHIHTSIHTIANVLVPCLCRFLWFLCSLIEL